MDMARRIARLTLGSLFVGHGTQKLFGWFGGAGPKGTAEMFEGLGLRPGHRHARGAGLAETAGGALLALGLLTPLACALLTGVMTTAIRKVHGKNGVWISDGGFEYNAVVIAVLAILAEEGPGRPSVDASWFPRLRGRGLAAASIGAGVAGSFLGERILGGPPESQRAPVQPPPTEAGDPASTN